MSDGAPAGGKHRGLAAAWRPGQSGNPAGRQKGSRHKLGEDFLKALHEDFTTFGVEAIQKCRLEDPVQYIKVVASILPKDINLTIDPVDELTDVELIERIGQLSAAVNAAIGGTGGVAGDQAEASAEQDVSHLRPN